VVNLHRRRIRPVPPAAIARDFVHLEEPAQDVVTVLFAVTVGIDHVVVLEAAHDAVVVLDFGLIGVGLSQKPTQGVVAVPGQGRDSSRGGVGVQTVSRLGPQSFRY